MPTPSARRLLVAGSVLALVTACSTDDGSGGATNTPGAEESELDAPQGTSTDEPDPADPEEVGDDPAQDPSVPVEELEFDTCEGDGFTIGYPQTWTAASGEQGEPCAVFGPGELGAADPSDLSVPIQLYVDPNTSFAEQPDPTEAELAREPMTVAGQEAVRIESLTPGDGGAPAGIELTTYRVDLGDQGLLTATTTDLGETDYERDQRILARMLDEMTIG